ncbi:Hsp33 family molecular chaperone HslO [Rubeoparvulum massiliense]|uniref:Hsp33 family molecular chaperone HslO n=1 Tax=Rubeoparvulum massiliense TaxID=1631346 RepID=UPI00065E50E5|nr:Hsp33 family molecular chaperone HslO [Rubeoparvulum massiliense]
MNDYMVRGLAYHQQIRCFAATTTHLVDEICRRHDAWPTASAALGRALTAGSMMGMMLKDEQKLTIQIKGDGPVGQIFVDANTEGDVRGYVSNPHVHFPLNPQGKLDVARAVGRQGYLSVTKDLGLREPYHGLSQLVSGELGEDFTYYFATSEQTPSAVGLGVIVHPELYIEAAGGFILQVLPDASEAAITLLEERLKEVDSVSSLVKRGLTPEEMLHHILGEEIEILGRTELQFTCSCSKERVERTLLSLGIEELEKLLKEQDEVEVTCHFCHEQYRLSHEEVENLLQRLQGQKKEEQKNNR